MVGVLAGLTFMMGPIPMLKLYGVPYLVRATCPPPQAQLLQQDNLNGWCLWCWKFMWLLLVCVGICCLAGYGHILAPSWPRRQASLVPWKGDY